MNIVDSITRKYGTKTVLHDVSLTVRAHKIHALLGPNGAGKSTLMNVISGLLLPHSGLVNCQNQKIGFMPEFVPLYLEMKVVDFLLFISRLKGASLELASSETDEIINQVKLSEYSQAVIGKLSKGYKQRVGLAAALLGRPDILILDEPLSGLDPKAIKEMNSLFQELKNEKTIIYSSHLLSEVEKICDDVTLIDQGKILKSGSIEDLFQSIQGQKQIDVTFEGEWTYSGDCHVETISSHTKRIDIKESHESELFFQLAKDKIAVKSFTPNKQSLESFFLKNLGGNQ